MKIASLLYKTDTDITFEKIAVTTSSSYDAYFTILSSWKNFPDWDKVAVAAGDSDILVPANSTIEYPYSVSRGPSHSFKDVYISATVANVLTFRIY